MWQLRYPHYLAHAKVSDFTNEVVSFLSHC